jgi:hypothetical protein
MAIIIIFEYNVNFFRQEYRLHLGASGQGRQGGSSAREGWVGIRTEEPLIRIIIIRELDDTSKKSYIGVECEGRRPLTTQM